MAPSRFRRDRARDVTPFRDSAPNNATNAANVQGGNQPNRPTTPGPTSQQNRPTTPGPTSQPNRPTTPGPNSQSNRSTTPRHNRPSSCSPCSESRSTTPSPDSRPTTPGLTSPVCVTPSPEKHPIWTSYDAPINFTWVIPEELCGMGWPKSRDQVRFLITQGIDHLVTLSPEKIPPVYAFPDLKHTSIPVEDFTGPTIAEIQKFIVIMDEARGNGEAVGVHCAEGRGRTGVMCACYLIYYHDMEPWDAIRIMRRQRPGSVERKIQEETVIKFWTLIQDYGKSSLDKLEEREKQLMEQQKRQQSELLRESDIHSQQMTMNLLGHMSSFYKQGPKVKAERCQRMRRAKSMTKIEDEEEKSIAQLKNHLASFFTGSGREARQKRSKSQARDSKDSDGERGSRATTPGRGLIEEVKLKPVGESKPKNRLDPPAAPEQPCEYKNHFRDFMRTPAMNPRTPSTVKRGRSFSQPRDKDKDSGKEESLSRKESFEHKYVADRNEQENPLEKHSKRLFKIRNKSDIVAPNNTPNDSDSHYSGVLDKPVECDNRYKPSSEEDIEEQLNESCPKSPPPILKPNRFDQETDATFYTRTRANANTNTKTKRIPKSEKSETEKMAERREKRARNRTIAIGPQSSDPYSKPINFNTHHNYSSNVLPDLTLINSNTNIIKLTPDLKIRDNSKTSKKDIEFKNVDPNYKSTNSHIKHYSKPKETEKETSYKEEMDQLETIIPEIETTQINCIMSRRSSQELLNLIIKARGSRSRTTSECHSFSRQDSQEPKQGSNEKRKSKTDELLKIPQKQYSRTSSRELYPRSGTSSEKCLHSRQNSQEKKEINQEKRTSKSEDYLSINGYSHHEHQENNLCDRRSSKSEESRILRDIAENGLLTNIVSRRPSATPSETTSKRSSVKKVYSRNPSSDALIYENSDVNYMPTKSSVNHDRGSSKTAEMLAKKNEKRNDREESISKSLSSTSVKKAYSRNPSSDALIYDNTTEMVTRKTEKRNDGEESMSKSIISKASATAQQIYSVSEALLSRGINNQEKVAPKVEDAAPNGIKIHPKTEELISKGLKIHPQTEAMITKGLNNAPKTEEAASKCYSSKELCLQETKKERSTIERNEEKKSSKSFVYDVTENQEHKSTGLRRNTYRKTYSRQRSDPLTKEVEKEKSPEARSKTQPVSLTKDRAEIPTSSRYSASVQYTQSTTPHRPTTPGPYLGIDRPITPGPYSGLSRESWKRTNQKFSYAKFLNYSSRETYL